MQLCTPHDRPIPTLCAITECQPAECLSAQEGCLATVRTPMSARVNVRHADCCFLHAARTALEIGLRRPALPRQTARLPPHHHISPNTMRLPPTIRGRSSNLSQTRAPGLHCSLNTGSHPRPPPRLPSCQSEALKQIFQGESMS